MENLLQVLCNAKGQHAKAEASEIHSFISDITKMNSDMVYDWDEWSGEEWMSIMENKKKIAIIGIKIPIIFVSSEDQDKLQSYELVKKLHRVVIEDFDKEMWHLNLDEYKQAIPEVEWHSSDDVVNPNSFSTEEFWFATI